MMLEKEISLVFYKRSSCATHHPLAERTLGTDSTRFTLGEDRGPKEDPNRGHKLSAQSAHTCTHILCMWTDAGRVADTHLLSAIMLTMLRGES